MKGMYLLIDVSRKRLIIGSVVLVLFVTLLMVAGCTVFYVYRAPVQQLVSPTGGSVEFEVFDLEWELNTFADPKKNVDYVTSLPESRRRVVSAYRGFEIDPSKSYWHLNIYYRPVSRDDSSIQLIADSVLIRLQEDSDWQKFEGFEQITNLNINCGKCPTIGIAPVTLSKDYKGDFYLSFILIVNDMGSGSEIERIPVSLRCTRTRVPVGWGS